MKILKDLFISIPLATSLILVIISTTLTFIYLSVPQNINLIVRFESIRGIESFGSLFNVLLIIGITLLYIALDSLVAWFLYDKKPLYSYLAIHTTVLVALLLLIYVGVIIGIN